MKTHRFCAWVLLRVCYCHSVDSRSWVWSSILMFDTTELSSCTIMKQSYYTYFDGRTIHNKSKRFFV